MISSFISYRRVDCPDFVRRLYDKLTSHFGTGGTFLDVDTIRKGVDFRKHISDAIVKCDVLLVVIGEKWLQALSSDGSRRIDDPDDYVRIEVETALARGIPVIPVIVGDAALPGAIELPVTLQSLAFRNAAVICSDESFDDDVRKLIRNLDELERDLASPAGRAGLLLSDRAAKWQAHKFLPSFGQWLWIKRMTAAGGWTPPQKAMMRRAQFLFGMQLLALVCSLAVLAYVGVELFGLSQAHATKGELLHSRTSEIPGIVSKLRWARRWLDPLLRQVEHDTVEALRTATDAERLPLESDLLRVRLALLPIDEAQVPYLYERLLLAEPQDVNPIRTLLEPLKDKEHLTDKLWAAVTTTTTGKDSHRLQAAAALALYDVNSNNWNHKVLEGIADDIVRVPATHLALWMELLRPIKGQLVDHLAGIFREAGRPETERSLATDILADYAADNAEVLANLLMNADKRQFAVIFPKLKTTGHLGTAPLTAEVSLPPFPSDLPSSVPEREIRAKRQANAAIALIRLNQTASAWKHIGFHPRSKDLNASDARVRSYLIHQLADFGVDSNTIIQRLEEDSDPTVRRALVLSLGEYDEHAFTEASRLKLLTSLRSWYRAESDPGLHSAVEWLLRKWKQDDYLKQVNDEWTLAMRWLRTLKSADKTLKDQGQNAMPQWYVNSQGQKMIVIPGPVEFTMGSPKDEKGAHEWEPQVPKRIARTFAISSTPVTFEQMHAFFPSYKVQQNFDRMPNLPAVGINWYMAAYYCNWLSAQDGIPESEWCYEKIENPRNTRMAKGYLGLLGYRIPTEAEMEYATRAGAVTSRCYGETDILLPKYGWFRGNSEDMTWPVGSLKPNDLGLFDVHGNVFTWCQDKYRQNPAERGNDAFEDREEAELGADMGDRRGWRGGSYMNRSSELRSGQRYNDVATTLDVNIGIRVARTFSK